MLVTLRALEDPTPSGKHDVFSFGRCAAGVARHLGLEPRVAFVSSHPGWTRTAAVEAAYGSSAKYLEPMRDAWQGAEGQCWLCVVDRDRLENGGFYLDRSPQRKHLAGPFFTGGSATKNSLEEAEQMVRDLDALALKAGGASAEGVVLEK